MTNVNPNHATVRHSLLQGKTVAAGLSALDNTCTAGAASTDVQGSPVSAQALTTLQKAVTTAHTSLTNRQSLAQALLAAIKALKLDFTSVKVALRTYEAAVGALANGNASVINKAGLLSRDVKTTPAALGKVSVVHSKPGQRPTEAIVTWPRGPGATGYAIEVNFTPQTPTGPWTTLPSGTGRRRVIKGATPGAQFLVRVASRERRDASRLVGCDSRDCALERTSLTFIRHGGSGADAQLT